MGTWPDWALYLGLVSCHCRRLFWSSGSVAHHLIGSDKAATQFHWAGQCWGLFCGLGRGGAALRLIPHDCCWWLCCATNKYSIDGLGKYKLTGDWWSDSCATQSPGSMLWSVPRAATLWNIIGGCNKDICMCVSVRWYSPLPPGVMDLIIYNEYHRKRQLLLRHIYIQIHPVTGQYHSLMYKYQLKHWGIMPSNILHGQYV